MSLDGTNTGLQASLIDHLGRPDLVASIPDFVAIAEADLNRKLRVRLMMGLTASTVTSQFATAPTDFAGVVSMWNANGLPMNARSIDAIIKLTGDNAGGTGVITDYSVIGANFAFYPVPTAAQATTMAYYKTLPPLATFGTNWLLKAHPDTYLYGALIASAPYLRDDDRVSVWGAMYANAVGAVMSNEMDRYGERLTPQPSMLQIV